MKKLFENFYLVTKLSFSLGLLICLIFVLYIFYINYQKESTTVKTENSMNEILKRNIDKNSSLINQISMEIKNNQIVLNQIKENINNISLQNENDSLSEIEESINNLNKSFESLSQEFKNIKKIKPSTVSSKNNPIAINDYKREIIDLILIKYENNITFENEIKYLKKITSLDKENIFEKISIMLTNPYKGHNYLKKTFNNEVSAYLKTSINKNPNSFLNKIFLPYITISPTSENLVSDDIIVKIKNIKINLENQNIENAYESIINVKGYTEIFKISSSELLKYLDFKEQLSKLL